MKHIKMIIIDDEPIILRGLTETYPWQSLGFVIVGTATSAEAGLELIKEKKPQVVLSDIKMAQMTGLTLVDKAKAIDSDIVFILMSAYKEFEYAKKACDMGVFSYLVKPIEEEILLETMKSVYEYCEQKVTIEVEYDYLKEMLLEDKDSFQNTMFERYLQGQIDEDSFERLLEITGKNSINEGSLIGICVGFDITYCILNQEAFEAQKFAAFSYLQKEIFKCYKGWHFKNGPDKIIFILSIDNLEAIDQIKAVISEAERLTKMAVLSSISSVYHGIKGLRPIYYQIQEMYNLACESGVHMLQGKASDAIENKVKTYSENEEQLIISSIRKGDEEQLKETYIHFLVDIEQSYKGVYMKKCLHHIALSVEFFLFEAYGEIEEASTSFDQFYALLPTLSEKKAQDVLFELLKQVISIKGKYSAEKSKNYFNEYILRAIEYIDHNLEDEALNITSVSEYVYLNPVYFGRLFKSTLNVSFKQYVLNKRIELAKKKILEESSSIVTVGNEVGIPNSSYFTQVFKKITGCLPSEYKREMINETK